MTKRTATILTCALLASLLSAGCRSSSTVHDTQPLGVRYQIQQLDQPRPNRVHSLRVDLTNRNITPAVIVAPDPDGPGPAEAALTDPRTLADDPDVLAFINTNPWDSFPDADGKKNRHWYEGQPVDIHGLALNAGEPRSPAHPNGASVWITPEHRVALGNPPADPRINHAVAGFQKILQDSNIIVPADGPIHPRTAIGSGADGTIMYLVVVDGRQPNYSEGMNMHELATVMRDLGCTQATNMDGGGSSIMGLRLDRTNQLQILNSPSDRRQGRPRIRPLPMILTIKRIPE